MYHVSNEALRDGTILTPTGKQWTDADAVLEKHRPSGYISRQKSIFMFPSFDDASFVGVAMPSGGVEGYLYEVEPLGEKQWHHVAWYEMIRSELQNQSIGIPSDPQEHELELKRLATNYWVGEEYGEGGWEVLAPRAKIIRYLGPAEDIIHESDIKEICRRAGLL